MVFYAYFVNSILIFSVTTFLPCCWLRGPWMSTCGMERYWQAQSPPCSLRTRRLQRMASGTTPTRRTRTCASWRGYSSCLSIWAGPRRKPSLESQGKVHCKSKLSTKIPDLICFSEIIHVEAKSEKSQQI